MGGGERPAAANPYSGKFQTVMDSLAAKDLPAAKKTADDWHANDPGDVLALVALGDLYATLDAAALPRLAMTWGTVPGRSGELLVA